ncbi:hypothetical protein SDC9_195016 [bioreactor metagenome]|uniref:Uncharacterized protein n=1 Tax=bioreactor metagenome TaxID=1076179 RepID=A0A645IGI2_9ZZZZ
MGILYFRTVIEGVVRDYKNYVFYGMELQNQNDYFSYAYDDLICKTDGSNEPLLVNCYKDNWIREIKDTSAFLAQLKQKSFFIIGFDTPLWNYALTRNNGNTNSDLFGSNLNIDWNVKEDGIGLFIGCNKKKIKEFKFNK